MRVGVNLISLRPGFAGEDAYLRKVMQTIRAVQPDTHLVLFTDPGNHDTFPDWDRVCIESGYTPESPSLLDEAALNRAASKAKVERLFSPIETAPIEGEIPPVLLVFDMCFLEYDPDLNARRTAVLLNDLQLLCDRAPALVAPSDAVQEKLRQYLSVPLNKIMVAPPGADPELAQAHQPFIEMPYLLAVGDTTAFRNVSGLLDVFNGLRDEMPHNLVIVGGTGSAELPDWGPRIMRIHQCPVNHLAALYRHSDAYICTSFYEGSASNVLDALRAGARVTAGRVGAIPEVAGNVPLYFNPQSGASMVAAVRRALIETPKEREQFIRAGMHRASEYTWEKCAWKILHAFKREPERAKK